MYKMLNNKYKEIDNLFILFSSHNFSLFFRLLRTLNLCDNDIDNLQDLWQGKIEVNKSRNSINSDSTSGNSSFNDNAQLSSNSTYLKKVLSKPLIEALCEIVAKKPVDPVEYLGHWLLHYKVS